jgi:tetraacyldisaccharide 4'-kinase
LAIALARALADEGHRVALIGHAYRARPGGPRSVQTNDEVRLVGDDALAAARALDGKAEVFVAGSRAEAMDVAVRSGKTHLVVDGLLQASPRPLDDAVLVLDGQTPFGAGFCPPAGDLRAPRAALLAAADHVVALGDLGGADLPASALALSSTIAGLVDAEGRIHPLESILSQRVGLLVAVARPERLRLALARRGVALSAEVFLADHASFDARTLARAGRAGLSAWITTTRCATKLPPRIEGAPVLAMLHHVDVYPLLHRLSARRG